MIITLTPQQRYDFGSNDAYFVLSVYLTQKTFILIECKQWRCLIIILIQTFAYTLFVVIRTLIQFAAINVANAFLLRRVEN
ncbi:hypothetical protein D3C79_832770 [compost metagenome]